MKAHTRKNAISGHGAKSNTGKAQAESKLGKHSGTGMKASALTRPAAPGPGSGRRSPASAGRTQKPGVKMPADSGAGGVSEIRLDKPARRAAVRFPIVGIGASAGGLEACTHLLQHLPLDTGMGFVLVQHLDPAHASALTQLLARATRMPVREVSNNMPVQPNHVYVIPPNTTMAIAHGNLKLQPRVETSGAHRSIDFFLESLAQDQHERAIGVILSGTASDGTLGTEAIKAEGGITFAQDKSARYDSMPRSAIAAGCVDFVLSPETIAKELARIARHPYVAGEPLTPIPLAPLERERKKGKESADKGTGQSGFQKILFLLRNHSGVDLSIYKSNTVHRS